MSDSDKKKEKEEYELFKSACEYCNLNNVHERTKNIMRFLNGEHIDRSKNDRPDIVNVCKRNRVSCPYFSDSFLIDYTENAM